MIQKMNIAVVAGGFSGESVISLQSAATFMKYIDRNKYIPFLVKILDDNWVVELDGLHVEIDKNSFSFNYKEKSVKFDFALIIIHGTPGEDGLLQGYFEMLNIPFSTGDSTVMGLTFDKGFTQLALGSLGYHVANHILVHQGDQFDEQKVLDELGLPCFVKPTRSGSSLGITKVSDKTNLIPAIEKAFEEHHVTMIESELKGVEITCGVFMKYGEVVALPVTEIVSANEFFDYDAKYHNKGTQEITPARISKEQAIQCQLTSKKIYKDLDLNGIVRIDFMLVENKFFVIEVNTVPGMSEASIVPKQLECANIPFSDFIDALISLDSQVIAPQV